tara:strand:+ start:216 stop:644 length:429 start_codon:yes stop_codon:yes gene_type:complete
MANKTPTKTSFTKANQPKGRGKSERTKILEAMVRFGKTEEGFYDLLMEKAFNPEDNFTFKELLNRLSPIPKAVSPLYKFDLPKDSKPHEKADYILTAIADGEIPGDIGNICIQAIKAMIDIEEYTDLKERIIKLEETLNGSA